MSTLKYFAGNFYVLMNAFQMNCCIKIHAFDLTDCFTAVLLYVYVAIACNDKCDSKKNKLERNANKHQKIFSQFNITALFGTKFEIL